jgi:formamidopyrimidine-DNA glycosylase
MSGFFLIGKWRRQAGHWVDENEAPSQGQSSSAIRLLFILDDGRMLAFSDVRKFAKVVLAEKGELAKISGLELLGPEPFSPSLTFQKFRSRITKSRRPIKQVLMDQKVIAGIGNIYADEILWQARVSPFRHSNTINVREAKAIFDGMKKILREAIRFRATSIQFFRDPDGKPGMYAHYRRVYQRTGELCPRCHAKIQRRVLRGRSTHFCPHCQKN